MEDFMFNLMARAVGAKVEDTLYPTTGDHVSSMIADETFHRELSSQCDDDKFTYSSCTNTDDDAGETDSSMDYPSYISLYGTSAYSSSPTYIPGDFYSLTPPASPSPSTNSTDENIKSARCLSFSIDSLIGNDFRSTSETSDYIDVPAQISSSSADDYIVEVEQKVEHQTTTGCENELTQCLYWCHVCEDVCSDHVDACMHQNIHFGNRDTCRLRKSTITQTGYVTRHELIAGYFGKVKCGFCEKIVSYRLFKVHLQCHEGHVCEICDTEFLSVCRLRDHLNSEHSNISRTCDVCYEQFSGRHDLSVHLKQHELCVYQCSVCFQGFRTRYAQTVHQRAHTGSKTFACVVPGCYKSFAQLLYLQLHLNSLKRFVDTCCK